MEPDFWSVEELPEPQSEILANRNLIAEIWSR